MPYNTRNTDQAGKANYAPALMKAHDSLDLREFGRTIARRKSMILLTIALVILLTLLFTLLSKPVYRATATLQIEREPTKVMDIDFLGSGDIRDTRDFYQTQFELIRSRALAAEVIRELNLEAELSSTSIIGQLKGMLGLRENTDRQAELEELLLENLTVEPVKNSRLVAVSFMSSDPQQAAEIANAVANVFIRMNDERRTAATGAAEQYLQFTLKETKTKLDESEQRLNQYAREHEILQIDGEEATTSTLTLKELREELIGVQKERIAKESQYEILSDEDRSLTDRLNAIQENAAFMQTLGQKLRDLQAQQADSNTRKVRDQIAALETEIEVKINTARNTLEGDLSSLKKKEALLREGITKAKSEAMQEQDKAIAYSTLKREVATNQEIYQSLLQRMKEINIAGGVGFSNIAIIDEAQVPLKKFKPNLLTNLLFGTLLGGLLGLSAAFMREFLDDTVKDVNTLENATGLPVLGIIPESRGVTSAQLAQMAIKQPRSAMSEAFRSLRTALRFLNKDTDNPVLFITSACADEGKSTTAANLACTFASAGNKVLMIDADLRNPSLHKAMGIHVATGLSDYLAGKTSTQDITQATDIPDLYLIPAGKMPDDPAELLSSPQMQNLLETARREFDQVILDGPPVLGLADALVLASLSSATLLAIKAESTRTGAVENALKRLQRTQAPVTGLLLNRVDLNKNSGYDYGGYDYRPDNERNQNGGLMAMLKRL